MKHSEQTADLDHKPSYAPVSRHVDTGYQLTNIVVGEQAQLSETRFQHYELLSGMTAILCVENLLMYIFPRVANQHLVEIVALEQGAAYADRTPPLFGQKLFSMHSECWSIWECRGPYGVYKLGLSIDRGWSEGLQRLLPSVWIAMSTT